MTTLDDADLRRRYRELLHDDAPPSAHPTDDDWVAFADGTMDAPARARLADHLLACAACADVHRVVVQVREGAPAVAPDAMPRTEPGAWRAWYGLAAAAALAVVVSGTLWMTRGRAPAPPEVAVAGDPTPAAPPPASPASSALPAWAGSLGEPPIVRLPAALALTMRGAGDDRQAFMRDFGRAIAPYREGRFADAVPELTRVADAHPAIAETWFYLGVSQLFAGDADAAAAALARARPSTEVGEEAQWLEAVALRRAGRADDATARLRAICAVTGPFQSRACEAERTP